MAAQPALIDTTGQCFFKQCRRGQCGQPLGALQAFDQIGRCSQIPDAPAGRENFEKAADANPALQAV
jgi:hypothetical protein